MYRTTDPTIDELLDDLELAHGLGRAARVVNSVVRLLFTALAIPATPIGCLLGFVHGAFMLVTFGLYALLWSLVWLPFIGISLAMSWLWAKAPILWPVWLVLGIPFVIPAYVLALLGPQDPGGEDKRIKLGSLMAWPYTFFVMFEKEVPQPTGENEAFEDLPADKEGTAPRCPTCGFRAVRDDARFCINCGNGLTK